MYTDHKCLKWLNDEKMWNKIIFRWSMKLQEYNFEVKSIPGKRNRIADTLSRAPCDENVQNHNVSEMNDISKKIAI